jgi:hypothetical protein
MNKISIIIIYFLLGFQFICKSQDKFVFPGGLSLQEEFDGTISLSIPISNTELEGAYNHLGFDLKRTRGDSDFGDGDGCCVSVLSDLEFEGNSLYLTVDVTRWECKGANLDVLEPKGDGTLYEATQKLCLYTFSIKPNNDFITPQGERRDFKKCGRTTFTYGTAGIVKSIHVDSKNFISIWFNDVRIRLSKDYLEKIGINTSNTNTN